MKFQLYVVFCGCAVTLIGCAPQSAPESPAETVETNSSPATSGDQYYAPPHVESPQQTSNWCWAACFEMALRSAGIPTTQRTVVRLLKGAVVDAKISVPELVQGFNGRGLSVTYIPGKPTRERLTRFLTSSPPDRRNFIIERRKNGTPDWHAVMVFGYDILADGRLFIYMYDPLTNRESTVWYAYDDDWEATFFVTVNKTEAANYWADSAQVNAARY